VQKALQTIPQLKGARGRRVAGPAARCDASRVVVPRGVAEKKRSNIVPHGSENWSRCISVESQ
jgi:hypothetical protein